jgi:hypothetical protein
MPPPRHPVAAAAAEVEPTKLHSEPMAPDEAVTVPDLTSPTSERANAAIEPVSVVDPETHHRRQAEPPPDGQTSVDRPQPATGQGSGPSRPVTLYLEEDQIQFLEEAHIAGLLSTPRLDLSKSAVVRLALRRLKAEMTVADIAGVLRAQPTDPTKTGRKRR